MKKRILCMLLALVMIVGCVGVLASCGGGGDDPCEHVDTNPKDNKCDKCGETISSTVTKCDHEDKDPKDGKCDKCGKTMEEDTIEYPWEETDLLFKMTKNSNYKELLSTCERYLAGESGDMDEIDELILARNADAYYETKVNVEYDYYLDIPADVWGSIYGQIIQEVGKEADEGTPDMYCNFFYDMVAASLNSCFANVLSNTEEYPNYFEFIKEGYIPEGEAYPEAENDKGYMYEYMRSTTLAADRMYIIASDYFTDMIRAFFIVPVNMTLLDTKGADITGDLDGDGEFNIDDFYLEINQNKWTYNRMAEYSRAISTKVGNEYTLNDTLGFALSTGGLSASGILYSTNIEVVSAPWDSSLNDGHGDFVYSYPTENAALLDFAEKLKTLFATDGVIAVGEEFSQYCPPSIESSLQAVRSKFCENTILFGGIECVGALEGEEYQALKAEGGFGIAPVPLYKDVEEGDTTTYLTSIHNVGRPGAIARTTQKKGGGGTFSQCTAFLNYQSTHSDEILEMYYLTQLQQSVSGSSRGTADMLDFIRNNVRSSRDKTIEDSIGVKFDMSAERWHAVLSNSRYSVDSMSTYYSDYSQKKIDKLLALQNIYKGLPLEAPK